MARGFVILALLCFGLWGAGKEAAGDFLSGSELMASKEAAIHGDARSATALANHYLYFENDIQESNFWIRLAAELGDCRALSEVLDRSRHRVFAVSKAGLSALEERKRLVCK